MFMDPFSRIEEAEDVSQFISSLKVEEAGKTFRRCYRPVEDDFDFYQSANYTPHVAASVKFRGL